MNKFVYVLLAGLVISVVILFNTVNNLDGMDKAILYRMDTDDKDDADTYSNVLNRFCALRASLWDLQKNTDYTLLNQGTELKLEYSSVDMFSPDSYYGVACKPLDY